ncbi:MAG: beta strand repeat-containing protein, partial [Limisphaerales bacterium]
MNLNFSVTLGGAAPSTQTVTIDATNPPAGGVALTVTTSAAWLSVTGQNGTNTPEVFQVGINPAALPGVGTVTGTLKVSALTMPGVPTVLINITLNVVTVSTLVASPGTGLSFAQQAGGSNPPAQAVSIASSGSPFSYTAAAVTDTGSGWLSVSPTESTQAPATLFVDVNGAALSPGLYTGTITLTSAGASNSPYVIPITLLVSTNPILNINPSALTFAYQIGQPTPPAQTLTFSSSGSAINYLLTAQTQTGNWLSLSQPNGTTPGMATAQVAPGSLAAGTYNGTITVTSPSGMQTVPVTLLVTSVPVIQVDQNAVTINYQFGGSLPAAETLQVVSSSTPIPFAVSITSGGGPNFLSVTPASGTTPAPLTLSVNQDVLASLAPGLYTSSITITGQSSGNGPIVVPVQLIVSNTVNLNTSQNALVFNYQTGQAQPPTQTLALTSTAQPLDYTVTTSSSNCTNGSFISATPSTGTTPGSIAVSVDPTGIAGGTCMGEITITAPGAGNSPKVIPVNLSVSSLAFLQLDPAYITASAPAGSTALIQQSIALSSTNPNSALPYSVTASTAGSVGGWLQVSPAAGTTPGNLNVTINPSNLPPGVHNGTIQIAYKGGATSTRLVFVTLTVSATGNATVAPAQLTFAQQPGGAAPAPQTISISSPAAGVSFFATATSPNHFLSVTPTTSATPGTVTVAANGASLSQGTYTGFVTLLIPGAANSPLNVPVTLNIGNPVT